MERQNILRNFSTQLSIAHCCFGRDCVMSKPWYWTVIDIRSCLKESLELNIKCGIAVLKHFILDGINFARIRSKYSKWRWLYSVFYVAIIFEYFLFSIQLTKHFRIAQLLCKLFQNGIYCIDLHVKNTLTFYVTCLDRKYS